MANRTLTNLIPSIHGAVDVVSREQVGFIPSVTIDPDASRAAIGQTVYSPVTQAKEAYNVTPAVTSPDSGDSDVGNAGVAITKSRAVPIRFNGEQSRALGANLQTVMRDEIAQAMRTLTNEIETDLGGLYKYASRAYGTAGTTPFGDTKLADAFNAQKILDDNGAPQTGRSLVIDTSAAVNLGSLTQLTNVNEAGGADLLRRGTLTDLAGFMLKKSAKVAYHSRGTATATYDTDLAESLAVGADTIHLDTGTGSILTGDLAVFAGDTNKYLVTTGHATGGADIDIVIAQPGLRATLADGVDMAITANYRGNLAFSQDAIKLAARLPALPEGGDNADDRYTVQDPVSGLVFEVAIYRQYRQVLYEVSIAWGVAAVKPEHMAVVLG